MSKRRRTKIEIAERVFRVRRECRVEETVRNEEKENAAKDKKNEIPRVTLVRDAEVTPQKNEKVTVRSLPLRPRNDRLPERKSAVVGEKKPKVISGSLAKSLSTPELNSIYRVCGEMRDLKHDLENVDGRELALARLRSSPRLNDEVTRKSLKRGLNFDHDTTTFDENRLVPLDFDERKLVEKMMRRNSEPEENARKRRKKNAKPTETSFSVPEKYLEQSFHDVDS